eukprot:1763527-Rhodomonas_salina.2
MMDNKNEGRKGKEGNGVQDLGPADDAGGGSEILCHRKRRNRSVGGTCWPNARRQQLAENMATQLESKAGERQCGGDQRRL